MPNVFGGRRVSAIITAKCNNISVASLVHRLILRLCTSDSIMYEFVLLKRNEQQHKNESIILVIKKHNAISNCLPCETNKSHTSHKPKELS